MTITGTEVGAGLGGVVGMGFLIRFLFNKLGKKQDKEMCIIIKGNFEKSLDRGEEKFDAIIKTQTAMLISLQGITTELKHFNGKGEQNGKDRK